MVKILLLLFLFYYVKKSFQEIKHHFHGSIISLDFMMEKLREQSKDGEDVEKEIIQTINIITSLALTFIYIGFYITSAIFVDNFIFTIVSVTMILWCFKTFKLMYDITLNDYKYLSKPNYFHFIVKNVYALVLLGHIILSYIGG